MTQLLNYSMLLIMAALLTACSEQATHTTMARQAMAIENGEECHLCGMVINKFPGPKGQLYQRGYQRSKKFCSTRDMFAYLLDPEHKHQVQQAYVHNMAITQWQKPQENTYIDTKAAWYVIGHSQKGAMGPTLATFKQQADAKAFAAEFGGQLYLFEQLTTELVSKMSFGKA